MLTPYGCLHVEFLKMVVSRNYVRLKMQSFLECLKKIHLAMLV